MSAANAIWAARAAGIDLRLDGDDLVLEAAVPPPKAVLNLLSGHKPGIVALLRQGRDGWSAEDWRVCFDERAGIAEFDGGLTRPQAEMLAFDTVLALWLNESANAAPLPFGAACPACGRPLGDYPLLILRPGGGYMPLHSDCAPSWIKKRRADAAAALVAAGIPKPAGWLA